MSVRRFLQSELIETEIHVTPYMIAHIEHPLRDVSSDIVDAVKPLFCCNSFDYLRELHSTTLDASEVFNSNRDGRCICCPIAHCHLFDGRYRLQALTEYAEGFAECRFEINVNLRVCLTWKKDGIVSSHSAKLFCNDRTINLDLTSTIIFARSKHIFGYVQKFRIGYSVNFAEGRDANIATDLFYFDLRPSSPIQSFKHFVGVTMLPNCT